MSGYHIPVLLKESVDGLNIDPSGVYVDVTFGAGGHSKEILKRLKKGKLVAFDQDLDSKENILDDARLLFVRQNFKFLKNNLRYLGIEKINGLIADLGVSSHQFDLAERGFSFRGDGPLDMRMNQSAEYSARDVIMNFAEEDLAFIFWSYGEIKNSRALASVIAQQRQVKNIDTIEKFLNVIGSCVPKMNSNKYLAKVFQAIRIEVNKELDSLKSLLLQAPEIILESGRLVVITYHSLEDRLVKNFIKYGDFKPTDTTDLYGNVLCPFKSVNRHVIIPDENELNMNPRARSAKLRIASRTDYVA